jgi:hypothetical protein
MPDEYYSFFSLMFLPYIIRRSRNNQHYALNCATPLFNILALTCFGCRLPSSGSFLDPSELLEIQIEEVVYHIIYGCMPCVPVCCCSVGTTRPRHTGHVTTHYMIYHLFDLYFSGNSGGSKKLPGDGRLLPKHVRASILNKEVLQFSV